MKTVAVLCFENPFNKPSDGAKNDMKTRILALAETRKCVIDVYAFNKQEEQSAQINNEAYGIRNFYQFEVKSTSIGGILSTYPLSVFKRHSDKCVSELQKHEYDVIIYEGEHMSSYRINSETRANKHILRQHDIESDYRHELAKSAKGFIRKFAQEIESRKYKKLEKKIDTYFDSVLFISKAEKEEFDKRYPKTKSRFVFMPPSALCFEQDAALGEKEHMLVYFGNMELQNNYLSVLWFATKVFPLILDSVPDAKLKIIGKISDDDKAKLLLNAKNIEMMGYVDDLNKEIRNASLIVSPVLFGAGVKVKVIDALSYGQIVCATSKTIEGTELAHDVHVLVQDEPKEMAANCINVLLDRKKYEHLAVDGLNFVKYYHSVHYQSEILGEEIQ